MRRYVVVLENTEPGVIDFPGVPNAAGLRALMRSQVAGRNVQSPPSYLKEGDGRVVGFTIDRSEAKTFTTQQAAQSAIDALPSMVRPAGLQVRAVDD